MDAIWGLLLAFTLVFINGFFVLGEFAVVAVDRVTIEQMEAAGHRRARGVLRALQTLAFQLSGAQLGITWSSLLLGYIAEPAVASLLRPIVTGVGISPRVSLGVSIGLAFTLATATQMVVGELLPKNLAIAKPVETALIIASPLRWANTAFRPIIIFLNGAANFVVRLFGVEPKEELHRVRSLEELRLLVQSSREHGLLPEADAALLARSIDFGKKTVGEILTRRGEVVALLKRSNLDEMTRLVLETGHSRLPVYEDDLDKIVGVVAVKDIYRIPFSKRAATPVSEIMQEPLFVNEWQPAGHVLAEMGAQETKMAIVLDEYGGTSGIVTLGGLLDYITAEVDRPPPDEMRTDPAPVSQLSGSLSRDEVWHRLGLRWPEGRYDTLAGFLLAQSGRIPAVGDLISYGGWRFKVVRMDGKRIDLVELVERSEEEVR